MKHTLKEWFMVTRPWGYALSIMPAALAVAYVFFENSITPLNQAVSEEIAALHQYMYFHFHCDDQGYDLLAGLFKRTAIEEMLHVERLAELGMGLEAEQLGGRSGDERRVGGSGDVRHLIDEVHVFRLAAHLELPDQCAEGGATEGAEFFLVDLLNYL